MRSVIDQFENYAKLNKRLPPETGIQLSEIEDPERELGKRDWEILNRTIRYAFASEHSDRVNMWYEQLLPSNRVLARCRSFESALAFVEMGLGSAIVPPVAAGIRSRRRLDRPVSSRRRRPRRRPARRPAHASANAAA